jgi:O-antigen/teichoic acid export membrane protein
VEIPSTLTETATTFNVPRGTAYITIQQVVIYATSFIYYVLLIRILNLSQIGEVSLLTAALSIFTTLTQLALPVAATRFISTKIGTQEFSTAGAIARTSLRMMLTIAVPVLLLFTFASTWIGSSIFKTPDSATLLVLTFSASFLLDLTTLYGAFFLGAGLYAEMMYQNILFFPLSRGLGLLLAYRGFGPLGIPAGWAIGAFVTLILSFYLWKGKLPLRGSYPTRPLLVFSIPLFASAIITLAQGWGDITLLQAIIGQLSATGGYYIVVSSVAFLSILWAPAAGALYPALSSSYARDGPQKVSDKLRIATRFVNLTVLPVGAALAAVAPTALETVYGNSLGNQAIPFAILSATLIFSAQSLLLITALQAVGKTHHILAIGLTSTIVDLAAVTAGASTLGTTAGAIGRALLAVAMMLLAWLSIRKVLDAPVTEGLSKALALSFFSAVPLVLVDNFLKFNLHWALILRVPSLLIVFTICFLIVSKALAVFTENDFDLLEAALPGFLMPTLRALERVLVQADDRI